MVLAHIRTSFADAFFPRRSEWAAAFMLVALGWMLSANPALMQDNDRVGYRLLKAIAEQQTWSVILYIFGSLRLMILLINGAWRRSPWARAATAFVSCYFWTQLVLSFAPAFGFSFMFACGFLGMDIANVMGAMRDARTVDDAFARGKNGAGSK